MLLIVLVESLFVAKQFVRPGSADPEELAGNLADAGANLPPVGRSLFDRIMADGSAGWRIPYPFPELLAKIAAQAGCRSNESSCYRSVLIPLGRSLQRTAAAPEFFKYPRMVVAFNGESATASSPTFPLVKDRLYLGYQEKENLLEVISYNDEAGRFEFQFVKDYADNAVPRVFYANRAVCMSCHQNQAPIFSRQVWDETNANPEIAKRLKLARDNFFGLPISIGVDVPNAMDDATDRANLFAAYQNLWRDGCGGTIAAARSCRAQALRAALQYRLTGERRFEQTSPAFRQGFLGPLHTNWQRNWPDGIRIPDNDIPNRDPLQFADSQRLADVPARFEPLLRRGHKETWQFETDRYRLIKGVGEFFGGADIQSLRERLHLSSPQVALISGDEAFAAPGFKALDEAIERMSRERDGQTALDSPVIRREPLLRALFHSLDMKMSDDCCLSSSGFPQAMMDEDATIDPPPAVLIPFYAYCARCHGTREKFPPNFMHGTGEAVKANLNSCAERIFFRLAM